MFRKLIKVLRPLERLTGLATMYYMYITFGYVIEEKKVKAS